MTFEAFEAVFYTLAFLVPGFIVDSTLSMLVPRRAQQEKLFLLRFLTFSCFNYALCSWLIYLIFKLRVFATYPVLAAIAWAIVILVAPIAIGLCLGKLNQKEIIRKALQQLGFNPVHVIPTSWDWKFSTIERPLWVLVTLVDGTYVCGLFGSKSFASSEPTERDLYVQEVYSIDDQGHWQRVARSEGVWIRADQIRHIEFWRDEEEENGG